MARKRDPQTGKLLPEGIHPQISDRTGKVTYRARLSYGPAHARRHIGETHRTAAAAVDWLLQRRMEVNQSTVIDPSLITCQEFYRSWSTEQSRAWSGSRMTTVRTAWEGFAAPVIGSMKLQSVRRAHVQSIVDDMVTAGRATSTIDLYLIGYKSMFNAAMEKRMVRENPCDGVVVPKPQRRDKQVWNPLQLQAFLTSEADRPLFPFWAFMIATSCRLGEALAVQWQDIDLDAGTVWLRRTVAKLEDGSKAIVQRTKSGQEGRVVTLEPWIVSILEEMSTREGRVFNSIDPIAGSNLIYRELKLAAGRAGLPIISPHGLRHASATAMAMNGVEESIVQEILGHRSRETTRQIYIHVQTESKRKGTAALASVLGRANTTTSVPVLVELNPTASESASESDSENTKTG